MDRLLGGLLIMLSAASYAEQPEIIFTPITPVSFTMTKKDVGVVKYTIRNNTRSTKKLNAVMSTGMKSLKGDGLCGNGFVLLSKKTCTLDLQLTGKEMTGDIRHMPFLCVPDLSKCYFAEPEDQMDIILKD